MRPPRWGHKSRNPSVVRRHRGSKTAGPIWGPPRGPRPVSPLRAPSSAAAEPGAAANPPTADTLGDWHGPTVPSSFPAVVPLPDVRGEPPHAPVYDDFEGPQPSWRPAGSDAQYRVEFHQRVNNEAHTGRQSEFVRVRANGGTVVYFTHDIGAALVIDELVPSVWIKSDRAGLQSLPKWSSPAPNIRGPARRCSHWWPATVTAGSGPGSSCALTICRGSSPARPWPCGPKWGPRLTNTRPSSAASCSTCTAGRA